MPFINGTFKRGYNWIADAAAGIYNLASRQQADAEDIAGGLSLAMLRDGTGNPTADIPFSGHTTTGIRQAAANGEPVEFAQWQAGSGNVVNLIQNASFKVNQRGVSGTVTLSANAYGHDRWKAGAAGCTYTFALIGADAQVTITAGSLVQIVPAGDIDVGSYTLQNAGSAQGRIYQGTPGGFSAPPITGTLAAGTAVTVEFGTGTVFQPQLLAGTSPKAFARKPLAIEVLQCQAYYELMPFFLGGYTSSTPSFNVPYKVPKAAVPTIVGTLSSTGNIAVSGLSSDNVTIFGARGFATYTGSGAGTYTIVGSFTASCEP